MALIAGPNVQKPQTPLVDTRSDYEAYFTVVGQVSFNGTRSGPSASRPTSTMPGRWVGMPFFDTSLQKTIYLQSVNPDVWVTWSGGGTTSIPPPLTTQGDLYTRNASNDTRLPIGTQGQYLTVNTSQATLIQWTTVTFSPLTTKGDLFTFSTASARLPVGSEGQVLTVSSSQSTGLTWATPSSSSGGGWTMVSKGTTESRANVSTLADDAALIFNMFNGSTYRARGMLFYSTAAAADFQYQLYASGVSLANKARILHWSIPPGSATPTFANNTNVGIQTSITGAGGGGCLQIEAVILNDTGSTLPFSLQWAQNTADAGSTSVMAGSYFEYMVAL